MIDIGADDHSHLSIFRYFQLATVDAYRRPSGSRVRTKQRREQPMQSNNPFQQYTLEDDPAQGAPGAGQDVDRQADGQ